MTMREFRACVLSAILLFLFLGKAESQPGFSLLQSVHFAVYYQKDITDSEAQKSADYLEKDYSYMVDKLGMELRSPLTVRIYGAVGSYLSGTKQRYPWRLALYQRRILHVQPVKVLMEKDQFEKALSYELAVALLEQA